MQRKTRKIDGLSWATRLRIAGIAAVTDDPLCNVYSLFPSAARFVGLNTGLSMFSLTKERRASFLISCEQFLLLASRHMNLLCYHLRSLQVVQPLFEFTSPVVKPTFCQSTSQTQAISQLPSSPGAVSGDTHILFYIGHLEALLLLCTMQSYISLSTQLRRSCAFHQPQTSV